MSLLALADHAGVFVFALSGALLAVRHRLDVVGIVVPAAVVTFVAHPILFRLTKPVALLDALGLGVFTVTGCQKAIEHDTNALAALFIAALTAVGGGLVRDVLVSEIPLVLRAEIYALASLAGATVILVGTAASGPPALMAGAGFVTTVALRLGGMHWGWSVPRVPGADSVPPR